MDRHNHVYAVCDGMGGHQAGEVASMTASEVLRRVFTSFSMQLLSDPSLSIGRPLPASGELLLKAIRLANRGIHNMALQNSGRSGMGTTVVAVALESDLLSIAHVGDSRAYRLDQQKLVPLTTDHSWATEIQQNQSLSREEAEQVVGKNIITRALGVRENVEVDYRLMRVKPGDTFMLCSDGLCGFADDDEIFQVARRSRDDLERMTKDLVQMANDRGGADNVTVIALRIDSVDSTDLPEVDPFTLPNETPEILAAADNFLEKINAAGDADPDDSLSNDTEAQPPKKTWLVLIFVLFAIVAAWLMFQAEGQ